MLISFACREMTVGIKLQHNSLLINGGSGLTNIYRHMQRGGACGTAIIDQSGAVSVRTSRSSRDMIGLAFGRSLAGAHVSLRVRDRSGAPDSAAAAVIEARECAL